MIPESRRSHAEPAPTPNDHSHADDLFDEDDRDFWNPTGEAKGSSLSRIPTSATAARTDVKSTHGVNVMVPADVQKREIAGLRSSHAKPATKAKPAKKAAPTKGAKPAKKASKAPKGKPAKKAKAKSKRAA